MTAMEPVPGGWRCSTIPSSCRSRPTIAIDVDPMPTSVVVGFDDFTTAKSLAEIPNGYGGLDWSNWVATHRIALWRTRVRERRHVG